MVYGGSSPSRRTKLIMTATDKQTKGLRTWIEIDKKAIQHNVAEFRSIIPKTTKLCAVVKSNAYGHGLMDFTKEVVATGVDFLAVDSVVEGLRLREEGIKLPILILGYTLPEKLLEATSADLSISVSSFESLQEVINIGKADKNFGSGEIVPKIHIKVDTGMHRQGFMLNASSKLLKILSESVVSDEKGYKKNQVIIVEGLFTHFASGKDPARPESTKKQLAEFGEWRKMFKDFGLKPIVHACATAGSLLYPEAHFDMVRIGIGLYGLWPSAETQNFAEKKEGKKGGLISLKPVLSWKTIVSEVKKLPEGGGVGYEFTETLPANSRIVICPVGYWHGFPWALSGIGIVLIGGERCKVVGRVSMDMIIVDVTHIKDLKIGDEVVIFGRQIGVMGSLGRKERGDYVGVQEIAGLINTSWYELVTRLNPLIKKIII